MQFGIPIPMEKPRRPAVNSIMGTTAKWTARRGKGEATPSKIQNRKSVFLLTFLTSNAPLTKDSINRAKWTAQISSMLKLLTVATDKV